MTDAIWTEAKLGNVDFVAERLKEDSTLINRPLRRGSTLIYAALASGSIELVRYLLRNGADPTVKNDIAASPLYELVAVASIRRRWTDVGAVIALLVHAGASLDIGRESVGDTPLMSCARNAFDDLVIELLNLGASVEVRDYLGYTAAEGARRVGSHKTSDLLCQRPQKLL